MSTLTVPITQPRFSADPVPPPIIGLTGTTGSSEAAVGGVVDLSSQSLRLVRGLPRRPLVQSGCRRRRRGQLTDMPDVDLVAELRAHGRSQELEAELMQRVRGYAEPVLRTQLRGADVVDDLCQEVAIKVWRNLARFDATRAGLRTWVSTVANNALRDHWRRQNARPRTVSPAVSTDTDEPLNELPSALVFDSVDRLMVEQYCESRPNDRERLAVLAVLRDGYRIADIKALMPAVAGSVDRWVKRARGHLTPVLSGRE